jgi:hypothetical protein
MPVPGMLKQFYELISPPTALLIFTKRRHRWRKNKLVSGKATFAAFKSISD